MKIKCAFISILFLLYNLLPAQNTYIPDDGFEQVLIDLGYDDVLDDYVLTSNISEVTTLNMYNKNISDLTGIEDFANITYLRCSHCQLQSVDISQNTNVTTVMFDYNQLTSLDVSNNTELVKLYCNSNNLTTINVTNNTLLEELYCGRNQLTQLDISQNINLKTLICEYNQISDLNVAQNSSLYGLYANKNQLTALDISNNPDLRILQFGRNPISTIDLSNNPALTSLSCHYAQLTTLDLSNNTNLNQLNCIYNQLSNLNLTHLSKLSELACHNNQLSSLNLPDNGLLWSLYCWNNQLTDLNITGVPYLRYVNCSANNLTELDFSQNNRLEILNCASNQLTRLDLRNGNNSILHTLNATLNNLACIDVDDDTNIPANWTVDDFTSFSTSCSGIYIPDPIFEQALIDLGYDSDNTINQNISTEDALSVSILNINNLGITDLTGIEGFKNLTSLSCGANQLTSLDVSQNILLEYLGCYSNPLTSLNVSGNIALETLWCHYTSLTELDLSNNPNLTRVDCYNSQLTYLNVSNSPLLNVLYCNNNQLTSLDISQNTTLTFLQCHRNQLSELDISLNTQLGYLECHSNMLSTLDISNNPNLFTIICNNNFLTSLDVSHLASLRFLHCNNNQLTSLDLSNNGILTSLKCYNNNLEYLDLRNGNNGILYIMDAWSNNLTCIAVDDPNNVNPNWLVDAGVRFSCDCVPPVALTSDISIFLDENGSANITAESLDNGSYDNLSTVLYYTADMTAFTCDDIGGNTVTLTVTDDCGNSSTATATVTVVDNLPPTLIVNPDPVMILDRNNHRYTTVTVANMVSSVYDNCTPLTLQDIIIYRVESDEEEDADDGRDGRDGRTSDDMVIADDCQSVDLMDEYYTGANGRVYTIYMWVEDENGNFTTAEVQVHAPNRDGQAIKDPAQFIVDGKFCSPPPTPATLREDIIATRSVPGSGIILDQNFPNPFNAKTTIPYNIPEHGTVQIRVYNLLRQHMETLVHNIQNEGKHIIEYEPQGHQEGVYLVELIFNDKRIIRKMIQYRL